MHSRVGLQLYRLWHMPAINLRHTLAAIAILVIAGIGLLSVRDFRNISLEKFLFVLAVTVAPASAYALAYFRCLPDVLSRNSLKTKPLAERWSDFARLTSFVAIAIISGCWVWIIIKHFRGLVISTQKMPSVIGLFVVGMLTASPVTCAVGLVLATMLILLFTSATEQYLAQTMPKPGVTVDDWWRTCARRMVGHSGEWLASRLQCRAALLTGGVLLLFSLINRIDIFEGYGFQLLTGTQGWPTAEYTLAGPARFVLTIAGRVIYGSALGIGLLAIVAAVIKIKGRRLRQSRFLQFASTTIAAFTVCDLPLGVARLDSGISSSINFAVLWMIWILPIFFWTWRAQTESAHWDHTRIAILILYLPLAFAAIGLFPLALVLVPAYAFFQIGILLLSWGFLQGTWEPR